MKLQDIAINFDVVCRLELETGKTIYDFIENGRLGFSDMKLLTKVALNVSDEQASNLINDFINECEVPITELQNLFISKFEESGIFKKK